MDEKKYKPWAKDICSTLKNGEYRQVLKELLPYKDHKLNRCPVNLYSYIANNTNNINYAEYEQKGYFIGSGAIESGNKLILQDRLKRAGMRWNTATAQPILTLRTKAESDLWTRDVIYPFLSYCSGISRNF